MLKKLVFAFLWLCLLAGTAQTLPVPAPHHPVTTPVIVRAVR